MTDEAANYPLADDMVFMGVTEVCKMLKCSRSTLSRMRRDGAFPEHQQLTPNKVGWRRSVVRAHLDGQSQRLDAAAVYTSEDLPPDDLEDKALELIVKAIEKRSGKPVDVADLTVHTTRALTEDEFCEAEQEEFARYSERFKEIDPQRAAILAAWIFPSLRSLFGGDEGMRQMLSDPEAIERLGRRVLHDDSWAEFEAEWLEKLRSKTN